MGLFGGIDLNKIYDLGQKTGKIPLRQDQLDEQNRQANAAQDVVNRQNIAAKKTQDEVDAIKNFGTNYDASNPFAFNKNNDYINQMLREGQGTMAQSGQNLTRTLASRGTTDSGQATRGQAQLAGQAQGINQSIIGNDYIRQLQRYDTQKGQAFNQLVTGTQMGFQEKQAAQEAFYQQQAIDQQNAILKFQEEQANDPWNKYIAPLLNVATSIL